jgi:CHAT domain-containing protein
LKASPNITKAEALRLAMIEMIERGTAQEKHPASWAPFFVVGASGR